MDKLNFLSGLVKHTETHLTHALSIYQNLDEETLRKPADNGGWSISECLEHLNTYSRYYHPLLEVSLVKSRGKSTTFSRGWLGPYFEKMMDPDKGAAKYKAAAKHRPATQKSALEVVAEFISHQEKLLELLKTGKKHDLNAVKIPISICALIRLNAGDTFAFLITHTERHIRQADRNLPLAGVKRFA